MAWLPLPFALDPLLLHWFEEHFDLWGCAASIAQHESDVRRLHSQADLSRMRQAEKRRGRWKATSTRLDAAALGHQKAQAAPTHPGAPPEPRSGLPWLQ